MKTIKLLFIIPFFALGSSAVVQAQTDSTTQEQVVVPESYQETQEQIQPDTSVGAATYNIVDNEAPVEPGAAPFRTDSDVEELRVYSGSHDGNNVIKRVEIRIPVRDQDPASGSRSTYVPQ